MMLCRKLFWSIMKTVLASFKATYRAWVNLRKGASRTVSRWASLLDETTAVELEELV